MIVIVIDQSFGCESSPSSRGEPASISHKRLTSAKSLFTFDNSRSKVRSNIFYMNYVFLPCFQFFLCGGSSHKKSFSLQKFRVAGEGSGVSVSSSSDSISAPLLGSKIELENRKQNIITF